MAEQLPPSPLSVLAQGAVATFELYQELRRAGFTEDQALRLVAYMAANNGQSPREG